MTRKMTMVSIAVAALLVAGTLAATAYADDNAPQCPMKGQQMRAGRGPHGPGGPGMGRGHRPGRPGGPGMGLGLRRGYIEPCPESRALWEKLGRLQAELHVKQWELFELIAQENPNREAIKAKLKEIVEIRREIMRVHQELRKYWKPLPWGRAGERPGRGPRRGRGGPGPGPGGGGQLPPPPEK